MATINDLLAQLGVEDTTPVKTASVRSQSASENEIEKAAEELGLISNTEENSATKIASKMNGGSRMNLQDLYNDYFGNEVEKTASAYSVGEFSKEAQAEHLEKLGSSAGLSFNSGLTDRLWKVAMDMVQDSEATQERNQTQGVIPGATVAQPQLEVNRPADATKAMDTTPQYTDLLDKAVAKKAIERALEEGTPGDLSHGVYQVDTGLEMPTDQKDA
jgi:hypothetical protein